MLNQIVVADTSPLIIFGRLDSIYIIEQLFKTILIPSEVANECLQDITRPRAIAIKKAISKKAIKLAARPPKKNFNFLLDILDAGEAATIQLAVEKKASLLIDERLERKVAKNLGLKIIGTAGLLLLAKEHKIIDKIAPFIHSLEKHKFYLAANLKQALLEQADEI